MMNYVKYCIHIQFLLLITFYLDRSGQTSGKVAPVPQHTDILSTVVMFTFLDEPVPYRTKIPAAPVTLKQFKEFLPKKGNYR